MSAAPVRRARRARRGPRDTASARHHVRRVMVAGTVDSFGLALGWTTFSLVALARHGIGTTGLLSAAMFCGVALSAPTAGWISRHLDGRRLLFVTAAIEAVLRAFALLSLWWGAPVALVGACVLACNAVGWTGYAGMRAEIAASTPRATAMTRYVAVTLTAEAVGASLAALLPVAASGAAGAHAVAAAALCYGLAVVPTCAVATRSRVAARGSTPGSGARSPASTTATATAAVAVAVAVAGARHLPTDPLGRRRHREAVRARRRLLVGGAVLMAVCAGPTMLYVAISAHLWGRTSVAAAAIAFALGCLVAPAVVRSVQDRALPMGVAVPLWGAAMVGGWVLAPWSLVGLMVAQAMSGIAFTGLEGVLDHALSAGRSDNAATADLARGSAGRAIGSAVAVRLVAGLSGRTALTVSSAAAAGALVAAAGWAARSRGPAARRPRTAVTVARDGPAVVA